MPLTLCPIPLPLCPLPLTHYLCKMNFSITAHDPQSKARTGILTTDHGPIHTPIFMPVGTAGTVKAVHQRELETDVNAEIILGNTYHLYLRPGLDVIRQAGGLHAFNGWQRPILTDSGGYQVYSLSNTRKIKEEGVTFKSHIDGSSHRFTPEGVMDIQRTIGADIIMAFDECTPYPCEYGYARKSMEMTHRWLDRCITRFDETEDNPVGDNPVGDNPVRSHYGYRQTLFPIVQGSTYPDLRRQSAEVIASKERDGNAIGGLAVGEPAEEMYAMIELVNEILPLNKPRYLMGVGTPANILEAIALGVDMFDCVMPTRNARHGLLFTTAGIMNMKNEKWSRDFSPIDSELGGYASTFYSKAYLRHLFKSEELLGGQIASLHNLTFYLWLVRQARAHIVAGNFMTWKTEMAVRLMQRL